MEKLQVFELRGKFLKFIVHNQASLLIVCVIAFSSYMADQYCVLCRQKHDTNLSYYGKNGVIES